MSSFITSDGVALRYETRGTGPVVFVLQGGPNNICDSLIAELAPLEAKSTLVFHDYRGSGQSRAAPPATYTFERLADDVDELRAHLGHDSIAVLAHSMGGFIALTYALRHRVHCARLALVGTTPCGKTGAMALPTIRALGALRTIKALTLGLWFVVGWSWRPASDKRTQAMYAPMSVTQEARPELRQLVTEAHAGLFTPNDNSPHLMRALGTIDLRADLQRIDCPALVLYGSRDAVMVAGGHMLASGLPHAQVRVLDDVGHEPFLETPVDTFAALGEFLAASD